MHGHPPKQKDLPLVENNTRTLLDFGEEAKPSVFADQPYAEEARRCAYIAADSWPPGAPPYCGAPVRPGSSYCARHALLCSFDPASRDGAQIAIAQDLAGRTPPPRALKHLAACVVPEPDEEESKLDVRELPFTTSQPREEA